MKPPHIVGLDLAKGPDRSAITLRVGSRFICELKEGDAWTVFADTLVGINPNHPPRFIALDTKD